MYGDGGSRGERGEERWRELLALLQGTHGEAGQVVHVARSLVVMERERYVVEERHRDGKSTESLLSAIARQIVYFLFHRVHAGTSISSTLASLLRGHGQDSRDEQSKKKKTPSRSAHWARHRMSLGNDYPTRNTFFLTIMTDVDRRRIGSCVLQGEESRVLSPLHRYLFSVCLSADIMMI